MAPVRGFIFGSSIRDEDGFALAVLDQYGDWVSPSMLRIGIKSKMEVAPPVSPLQTTGEATK